MKTRDEHGMVPAPEEVAHGERWSRGEYLGWAVWRRMCDAAGRDPKGDDFDDERHAVIDAIRTAYMAFDEAGIDAVEDWLRLEKEFTHGK
jgi:hypothetical protein